MYRYDLHIHTAECDLAAHVPAAEIVRMYKEAGYDGIVITDHYFSIFFDWFAEELSGASHRQIIDRWLRGYHAAREAGEQLGLTVLAGAEVRFDGTINDYLLYGITEDFFYSAPLLNRLKTPAELRALLPADVCMVQAHPFRVGMTVADPAPLDGIEVYNGGTEPPRNRLAYDYAASLGKIMTSGSDFHKPAALAKGGIMTETPILTPTDLVSVLRGGTYTRIET